MCMICWRTDIRNFKIITLTLHNFCIQYPNALFFSALEPPLTCQQENMEIWLGTVAKSGSSEDTHLLSFDSHTWNVELWCCEVPWTESTDIFHVQTAMQRSPDSRPLVCICRLEIIGTPGIGCHFFPARSKRSKAHQYSTFAGIGDFSHVSTVSYVVQNMANCSTQHGRSSCAVQRKGVPLKCHFLLLCPSLVTIIRFRLFKFSNFLVGTWKEVLMHQTMWHLDTICKSYEGIKFGSKIVSSM